VRAPFCPWVSVAAVAATLCCAVRARAADGGSDASTSPDGSAPALQVIADYCSASDLTCTVAPLSYGKTISLPIAFDFDTGWQPPNSNLQVDFFLKLPASTTVELSGALQDSWPEAMTLATPGGTHGLLAFDYGLELGAKARIDVSVIGIPVKWEGDIPFVPKVDFEMKASQEFSPWGFAPGVSATGSSNALKVFEVNLLSLAGIPSQISKGGVALDVKGDLTATYVTDRIRIEPSQPGDLPIESEDGTTRRAFPGGAFVEYNVWPEGHVDYDGTLHLIPTFFVTVLGKSFDLPLVDLPVSFDIGTQDFVFDAVRVHVPLPDFDDVPATLDFGTVGVGQSRKLAFDLSNIGEAKGRATGFVDSSGSDGFALPTPELTVASMQTASYSVAFAPTKPGKLESKLTLVTNDPDERFITVMLIGTAIAGASGSPDGGSDVVRANDQSGDDAGCACRLSERRESRGGPLLLGLGLALALARRRRRSR
jgi:HYDIN/CFA65/VesB-like, Ig-like domain